MDPITRFNDEAEILLPPDMSFKIVKKEILTGVELIDNFALNKDFKASKDHICKKFENHDKIDYTVLEQI